MNEGDLCIWTGKQTDTSSLKNRIIYHVVRKENKSSDLMGEYHIYYLRIAYDPEHPVGTHVKTISWSGSELKKLSLVDLGVMRLALDNFIREFARLHGMEDELKPE